MVTSPPFCDAIAAGRPPTAREIVRTMMVEILPTDDRSRASWLAGVAFLVRAMSDERMAAVVARLPPAGVPGILDRMEVVVRPDAALWLFLPPRRRRPEVVVPYDGSSSLGHVVQALGIPLTEVEPPVVDGAPSGQLHDGAVIELAPPPRPQPLPDGARFLLDVHLGSLARRLRLLGIDTAYENDADDADLVERAGRERRVVLTQDRGLLMRRALRAGAHVRGAGADAQLADVLDRFAPPLAPWTRCSACNGELAEVPKAEVADRLEPGTRRCYERFSRCRSCRRVFWRGAHGRRLDAIVAEAFRTRPS